MDLERHNESAEKAILRIDSRQEQISIADGARPRSFRGKKLFKKLRELPQTYPFYVEVTHKQLGRIATGLRQNETQYMDAGGNFYNYRPTPESDLVEHLANQIEEFLETSKD